jgi:DNA-binding MarR family transcriptional regulator
MSLEASQWAWDQPLSGNAKLVLLALANWADDEWSCFPGIELIAAKTSTSKNTVIRIVQQLETAGYIAKQRRLGSGGYRTSNRYWLNPKSQTDTKDSSPKSDELRSQTGRPYVPTVGLDTKENLQEPKEDIRGGARGLVDDPLEQAFETVWSAWPKKADRKDAWLKFRSTVKKKFPDGFDLLVESMLDHAQAYRKYRPDPRYVPAMAVWLNKERWRELPITEPQGMLRPVPVQHLDLTDHERELLSGKKR